MTQSVAFDQAESSSPSPSQEVEAIETDDLIQDPAAVATDIREKFIPLTRFALLDRIVQPKNWEDFEYPTVAPLMRSMSMWRHQEYCNRLSELIETYMPFSPDRDTIRVLEYTESEKSRMQLTFIKKIQELLIQGNYHRVEEEALDEYFTATSPYGLNLKVDMDEYEEALVFCRGSEVVRKEYRSWKKLYLGMEYHEVPIFKRLFILFKLKCDDTRLKEIMEQQEVSEKKAKRMLKRERKNLPDDVKADYIYLKLFKDIPQSDLEMLFPNTKVDFKLVDKIKLGVTAGGGTIAGIAGVAGKLVAAFATFNIFALIGGFVGLIGLIGRQVMKFFNQRTQYMMVLAQNLYFHSLADNRGVLTLMCDRAEEEDIKEEMLLYSYLCQYEVPRSSLDQAQKAIEQYLQEEFDISISYDIEDALSRLERDDLVVEDAAGNLKSQRPPVALAILEQRWKDILKDHKPMDYPV